MDILCPKGHSSTDADYCSECGAKIGGTPGALAEAQPLPPSNPSGGNSGDSKADSCPDCGTRRANPTAVFCEVCRYNFATHTSWAVPTLPNVAPPPPDTPPVVVASPPPPSMPTPDVKADGFAPVPGNAILPSKWEAVVTVDASLYTDPDPNVPCPTDEPERVYHLDFAENLVGRRSDRKDIHPEINLRDPGASHRHAKLLRLPDGTLFLLDVGSTNGTLLNGVEVAEGVKTPLKEGDAITLGFWTRISIRETRS